MIKMSRSAMLLEFSRDYIEQLDGDKTYCHPYIRCHCGSEKVFNYGLPKNNGKYFFCRSCQTSFILQK